jgi:hypothetical protein
VQVLSGLDANAVEIRLWLPVGSVSARLSLDTIKAARLECACFIDVWSFVTPHKGTSHDLCPVFSSFAKEICLPMALLELPAELIFHVMDYVGSTYFHQDLSRLTVCKEWYRYALPSSYKDISLSQSSLQSLLKTPNVAHTLTSICTSLDTLSIVFTGNERPNHSTTFDISSTDSTGADNEAAMSSPVILDADLARPARTAKEAQKLRCVHIRAPNGHASISLQPLHHELVRASTIQGFLSAQNLAVLDIDPCGKSLVPPPEGGEHICHSIGSLLATLTHLRLRMRTICVDALTPPKHAMNMRLTEVIVNLSLYDETLVPSPATHATPCTGGGKLKLKNDMEGRAKDILKSMSSPKTVRVLTHTLPKLRIRSLDVLTDKYMELEEGAAWDDDGRTIVDDVDSESDIVTDSSSVLSDP